MVPRVVVLLLVGMLIVLVCITQARGSRSRSRSRSRRRTTPTSQPVTRKMTRSNMTRYPGNLCMVCTVVTYQCNYTVSKPCFNETTTTNGTRNGTIVRPEKISTKERDEDYYDDWNRKYYSNDIKGHLYDNKDTSTPMSTSPMGGNRKRRSPILEKLWDAWHKNKQRWFNNSKQTTAHPDRQWGPIKRCEYNATKTCNERKCNMQCCDGTPMNTADNSCTKKTDENGNLLCLNGGTLTRWKTSCYCLKGYSGTQCQHRKCSMTCRNGGVCKTHVNRTGNLADTNYNDDYCVCPSDATGKFCETKKCSRTCRNNGTCESRGSWSQCLCKKGFSGSYCEVEHKKGDCPARSDLHCNPRLPYRSRCTYDRECPSVQKCCQNSCYHRVCTLPYHANATCTYNNVTYQVDSVFTPDPCRFCTCNQSHVGAPHGVIECTRILCPKMPKYCTNITTPEGACCPICAEDPDVTLCSSNYTFPYFKNCPDNLVTFDVDEKSNAAVVNLDLYAYDCKGDRLNVIFSEDVLLAGIGEDNFHLLSASSARDTKGNFAECAFHARVRDPYPPVFLTCPTSFPQPHPGPVNWEVPVARDNVGLSIPPTSRYSPGQMMPPGDVMIEYWAEDYQGNIARCSFIVSVGDKLPPHRHGDHHGTDDHGHSHTHVAEHSHPELSIGLGISSTLIVIIILGIAFFFCRQRKQWNVAARGAPATAVSMSSVGNGLGNGGMGWNNVSIPPQRYSLSPDDIMSPPMYSRTDEMIAGLASGGEEAGELPSKNPLPK